MQRREVIATAGVLFSLIAVPLLINWHQHQNVYADRVPGTKVITLTGVGKDGVWTLEDVNAFNYGRRPFAPATLQLMQGDSVVLRLQTADVHHRFYVPALELGPVDVEPGYVEEVAFEATQPGTYEYFCTSLCGDAHFYMKGWIVVSGPGEPLAVPEPTARPSNLSPPPQEDMVGWGEYLYVKEGCTTCHGVAGKGGVENFNYVKRTIPTHEDLAEKLFLEEQKDADAFVEMLKQRTPLDTLEVQPDIPRFSLVLAQYQASKDIIQKGKDCARLDADGPVPPLQMPAWQDKLSDYDVDAILAYLITLYPWEQDEWDEEEWED